MVEATKLRCPKCLTPYGRTYRRHQARECMTCGYVVRGSREIHKIIMANRKEIAEDYLKEGLLQTLYKWGISPTALYRIPEVRALKGRYSKLAHKNGHKPHLPEWSDDWLPEVQLKWLEIYKLEYGGKNEGVCLEHI